jgi:hypothetical protein
MLKAPKGRVAGLADALGRELRNLPIEAPSASTADALIRRLEAVARIMRAKDNTTPPRHRRKG